MTTTVENAALARVYEDGVEEGLKLASERLAAYLAYVSGDPHAYLADVIAGKITGDMVAEWPGQYGPATPSNRRLQ